jgi:hypothetical protein
MTANLDEIRVQFLGRLSAPGRSYRRLASTAWRGALLSEMLREEWGS